MNSRAEKEDLRVCFVCVCVSVCVSVSECVCECVCVFACMSVSESADIYNQYDLQQVTHIHNTHTHNTHTCTPSSQGMTAPSVRLLGNSQAASRLRAQ